MSASPFRHQRADGGIVARFAADRRASALVSLFQSAPMRLLLPDPEPDEWRTAALLNTGGGLAGGDRIGIALTLGAGARLSVTTAAAEKVYRTLGPPTRVEVALDVAPGAALEWIPQETILFDGAGLHRRGVIALAADSRLLLVETLAFGRAARGEVVRTLLLRDTWRVRVAGQLVWQDSLRLEDAAMLAHPLGFAGAGALATLLCAAPEAVALVPQLRAVLASDNVRTGATSPGPGLAVARLLGPADAVRLAVSAALPMIRADFLGQPRRLPRLWTN